MTAFWDDLVLVVNPGCKETEYLKPERRWEKCLGKVLGKRVTLDGLGHP